jgi:hypothetical protein
LDKLLDDVEEKARGKQYNDSGDNDCYIVELLLRVRNNFSGCMGKRRLLNIPIRRLL